MEITVNRKPINVGQLEGEMKAAFAAFYRGLSTDQKSIRFIVDDSVSQEDIAAVETLYAAHVPTETDEQTEQRKRGARRELRQLLRGFDRAAIRSLADALPYLEAVIRLTLQDD